MEDHGQIQQHYAGAPVGTISQFALRVVSELRRNARIETGEAHQDILKLVLFHAANGEAEPLARLFVEMKRRGITAEQIIDIYFPAAIGKIGDDWHEGDLDVLQATLCMSRLQVLLRELGRAWMSDSAGLPTGPRILLVLPGGEQHTLGAMVAANQMRRIGVSVRVCLVPKPALLAEQLENNRFDAVFVSAANRSCLASCADLVKTIRRLPEGGLPIVLGGGILSDMQDDTGLKALASHVGADLATLDVTKALAMCGFNSKAQAAE
ncbi:cobalamin B12-binding domain-containing protein [Roseibaca sp. Y0-43]|uniref:cobalamin B12-binding domain-containing protein n=1 Tax=Roseibaca sp. Y0-43 TaxID=2816854 RepID=UPI001D0CC02A|nr:cobalamin B12-binding domain-containing protein [Roseibaca sp. Y0-43]MCC1482173.1 cobalamin-dependent protein [Roseibaca sp. Y0-43]